MFRGLMFFAALMLAAGHARAVDWQLVGGSSNGDQYVDVSKVKRSGDVVQAWVMSDFHEERSAFGTTYLSTISQEMFFCNERSINITYIVAYSGNKASGRSVGDESPIGSPKPAVPGSNHEAMLDFVCSMN